MGYAYMGSGKIRIAPYSTSNTYEQRAFVDVENASIFEITLQPDEKELMDFTNPAGGTDASVKRIKTVTGKMDLRHFTAANLARAMWGTTTAQTATPITGEAGYKINAGGFIATKRLIDITVAPVLKKGGTAILSADFTYSAGGVQIASTITTPAVNSGDAITIDYTPLLSTSAHGLQAVAPLVSIHFEGIDVNSGKQLAAKIWQAKLGSAQSLSLIGDEFGVLSLPFMALKDSTISAATNSQFCEIQIAS